jgi:hypothetical protein
MGKMSVLAPRAVSPTAPAGTVVEGQDCGTAVLAGSGAVPSIERAVDRALSLAPNANALLDVTISNRRSGVPLFYVTNCLTVKGTAAAVREGK